MNFEIFKDTKKILAIANYYCVICIWRIDCIEPVM